MNATKKQPRKRRSLSMKQLAACDFDAAITEEEMCQIERVAQDNRHAISRRIATAVLTRSKLFLTNNITTQETAEAVDASIGAMMGTIEHLKGVVEMMETACARQACVLAAASLNLKSNARAA